MPEILVTRRLPEAVLGAARAFADVTVREGETPLTPSEARAALHDHDVIVPTLGDAFRAEVFEGGPFRCRGLANFGVGYNHIDAAAAASAGLVVTNTPGAVTDATADIALTLMLMVCRRAGEGERLVRAGRWAGWQPTQMLGLHMTGKTLGVVGMGRIGKAVAARAHRGFGMEVVFHNRSPVPDPGIPARQLPGLHEVMAAADVVVLAVPATPQTRHLVDAAALAAMKPTGRLVNVARGDVVDERAFVDALKRGENGGAGQDVYEHEPQVPQARCGMENVTLLPHLGTAALEVREAMGFMAVENARAIAESRTPPNPV